MKKAALLISALTICLTFAFCSKDHQPVYRMTLDGSFTDNATGKVTEVKLNYKHVILYDNDDLSGHYIFRNGDKDSVFFPNIDEEKHFFANLFANLLESFYICTIFSTNNTTFKNCTNYESYY